MINAQEDLKVTDFGIARSICDSVSRVTMDRGTSGTLLYMSPQQALGQKPAISDDVYAIGATLYELLTSKPPFHSGNIARQLEEMTPPPMAERRAELELVGGPIPPAWEDTVAACLSKDPTKRPAGAMDVRLTDGPLVGPRELCGDERLRRREIGRPYRDRPDGSRAGWNETRIRPATTPPTSAGKGRGGLLRSLPRCSCSAPAATISTKSKARTGRTRRSPSRRRKRAWSRTLGGGEGQDGFLANGGRKEKAGGSRPGGRSRAPRRSPSGSRMKPSGRSAPQTYVVPDQFNRIQLAMDAAKAGDTIR